MVRTAGRDIAVEDPWPDAGFQVLVT